MMTILMLKRVDLNLMKDKRREKMKRLLSQMTKVVFLFVHRWDVRVVCPNYFALSFMCLYYEYFVCGF